MRNSSLVFLVCLCVLSAQAHFSHFGTRPEHHFRSQSNHDHYDGRHEGHHEGEEHGSTDVEQLQQKIAEQQATINELNEQIETLTVTEAKLSIAAKEAREACSNDFNTLCSSHIHQIDLPASSSSDSDSDSRDHGRFHGKPLGFGSRAADQCIMSSWFLLSGSCKNAISNKIEMNENYENQKEMMDSWSSDEHSCGAVFIVVGAIIFLHLCCLVRMRRRGRRMRKFVDAVYENEEIKAAVESVVGEPLPPKPRCCFNKRRCRIFKTIFITWFICSIFMFLLATAFGAPVDESIGFILMYTWNCIFFFSVGFLIVKLVKLLFRCLCCCCKRRHSRSSDSYPGANRRVLDTPMFNAPVPFGYQSVPGNDDNPRVNVRPSAPPADSPINSEIQMAYAGLPVQPPSNC